MCVGGGGGGGGYCYKLISIIEAKGFATCQLATCRKRLPKLFPSIMRWKWVENSYPSALGLLSLRDSE